MSSKLREQDYQFLVERSESVIFEVRAEVRVDAEAEMSAESQTVPSIPNLPGSKSSFR
jgi:hypothetical protein